MMNRSTQKELIKLMLQLNEMWPQLDLSNMEQQNMVLDILNTVSIKCKKDFSKLNAGQYVDTVESLGNVIKMTDWQHMASEELNQCISLCQEIILQVINNLRNEKELKKDIVFLPYQASMWDSLESVWKAANEDKEHCNTYVIPIPYADLTPEHTAAEWHCERGLFPEYVPTLDWQTIDLEEMHPDVIFIHNPYDEYNRVTSVESRYYSSNLKHCTDKLVYIPYSVEEEIQPGNEAAENAIEHRILLPAFMNADLIIAQSEEMKQAWINILTRRTNEKNRAYWEKRIFGLGSPKIDKVLTSKKEDFEMPEKWKKLIGNKKVILYITSIAPMLQNSDKVCAKLRYVFDTFRNRDDVVLWWRPHPLMKATFHSMRPQYEEEYLSLEKMYIKEGWGIYDDSSDLHRAICWSDAYYGDYSSVMKLYKQTGKPLMNELMIINSVVVINFFSIAIAMSETEKIYFVATGQPDYLCNLDLNTGYIECMQELPVDCDIAQRFSAIGILDDELLIAPFFSNECFLRYHLVTHTYENVVCPTDVYGRGSSFPAFLLAFKWNKELYFLGCANGYIAKYTKTHGLKFYNKWYEKIKEWGQVDRLVLNREGYVLDGNSMLLAFCGTSYIAEINMRTLELVQVKQLPFKFELMGIDKTEEYFWLLPLRDSVIIRWNRIKDEYTKIHVKGKLVDYPFCGVTRIGEEVILIPLYAESAYILDKREGEFVPTNQYFSELSGALGDTKMVFYARDEMSGARIGQSVIHDNRMYVDFNGKVQSFSMEYPKMENIRLSSEIFKCSPTLYEGFSLSLSTYISNLSNFSGKYGVKEKVGKKIYENVVKKNFLWE